ncbi:MAG: exonuclease domain-containing protein [Firmicutes bacterium]|nr:exonuclease domain-containing protein [Bacillota bacterium]
MKYIAIDFETATSAYYSPCALGIVEFNNIGFVKTEYFLIKPPDNYYSDSNIRVHRITPDDTKDAPTFDLLWDKIKHYFDDSIIFVHNAVFDISVLKSTLDYYKISQPSFKYCDTKGINYIPKSEKVSQSLDALCRYFDIPLEHHHALSDAKAAASLAMIAMNKHIETLIQYRAKSLDNIAVKRESSAFGKNTKISDIKGKEISIVDNRFSGKTIVITGNLSMMTREQAFAKIISFGGNPVNSVTSKTDLLVNAENKTSTKTKAAEVLQKAGHQIKIVSDEEFMKMLS